MYTFCKNTSFVLLTAWGLGFVFDPFGLTSLHLGLLIHALLILALLALVFSVVADTDDDTPAGSAPSRRQSMQPLHSRVASTRTGSRAN